MIKDKILGVFVKIVFSVVINSTPIFSMAFDPMSLNGKYSCLDQANSQVTIEIDVQKFQPEENEDMCAWKSDNYILIKKTGMEKLVWSLDESANQQGDNGEIKVVIPDGLARGLLWYVPQCAGGLIMQQCGVLDAGIYVREGNNVLDKEFGIMKTSPTQISLTVDYLDLDGGLSEITKAQISEIFDKYAENFEGETEEARNAQAQLIAKESASLFEKLKAEKITKQMVIQCERLF